MTTTRKSARLSQSGCPDNRAKKTMSECIVQWCQTNLTFVAVFHMGNCGIILPDIRVFQQQNHTSLTNNWAPIFRNYSHVANYSGMVNGVGRQGQWKSFAMRSWRQFGTRFFATVLVAANTTLWHVWVTVAGPYEISKRYRTEIRLASEVLPECTSISFMPGMLDMQIGASYLSQGFEDNVLGSSPG